MEQNWYFPKDNGGDEKGFEDQGTNHFKSSPYGKLAREIIQNSFDAKREDKDKVIVKFELLQIDKSNAMNIDYIEKSLKACCDYFNRNEKLNKFYQRAKKDLENEKVNILKISDYNTTGLYGIDRRDDSAWYGLVKSTGNSTKIGISGGSYGSGKHAPFVFSNLRTVFYSTYVEEEEYAFQGKSILCAHEMDGELKTNVGFFGNVEDKCYPIRNQEDLNEIYRRNEPGTDVYIVDCNMKTTTSNDNEITWYDNITLSIIENFWKIILEDKLEVQLIDNNEKILTIDKENVIKLAEALEAIGYKIDDEEEFTAHKFISVHESNEEYIYGNILEDNDVRIKILKLNDTLDKKILYLRNTEMKIRVKEVRKKQIGFYAIFEAVGEKISGILRDSEPQTHDDWNPNNIEDEKEKKLARKCLRNIDTWINSEVDKLLFVEDVEEIEVEGLDSFLIDDDEDINKNEADESIFDNRKIQQLEMEKIEDKTPKNKRNSIYEKNSEGDSTTGGNENNGEELGGEGDQQTDGNPNSININNNGNGKDYDIHYTDHKTGGNEMHLVNVEFIGTPYDSNENIQKIIIKPFEGQILSNAKISLFKIVDSGDLEKLNIENAYIGDIKLHSDKNDIINVNITKSICINVELTDRRRYLTEVKIYV